MKIENNPRLLEFEFLSISVNFLFFEISIWKFHKICSKIYFIVFYLFIILFFFLMKFVKNLKLNFLITIEKYIYFFTKTFKFKPRR